MKEDDALFEQMLSNEKENFKTLYEKVSRNSIYFITFVFLSQMSQSKTYFLLFQFKQKSQ